MSLSLNKIFAHAGRDLLLVPARLAQVVGQVVVHILQTAKEPAVSREQAEPIRPDLAEHPAGVAPAGVPQLGVDGLEQVERVGMPGPPQVGDYLSQGGQLRWEGRANSQTSKRFHPTHASTATWALGRPATTWVR